MRQQPIGKNGNPLHAYYYYGRDDANRPVETNCFVTDGQEWAAGFASCHAKDNPCKATGRRVAYSRAMDMYFRGTTEWLHDKGNVIARRGVVREGWVYSLASKFIAHYNKHYAHKEG